MSSSSTHEDYTQMDLGWCSRFPSSWTVMPCRAIVSEKIEKNENSTIQNYLSLMANVGVIAYEEKGEIKNQKTYPSAS